MATTLLLLGPLELTVGGEPTALRPAQRRVLSILALDPGRDVPIDVLTERMWPSGPPATARTALHVHISKLRGTAPDLIVTTDSGYEIGSEIHIDRTVFEEHAREAAASAQESDWDAAVRSVDTALSLWRGTPFAELADDDFAASEITRLDELRLATIEVGIEARLALDQSREVLPNLQAMVSRYPLRERLRYLLMLALYRSGRQAEALREYHAGRRILGEELGLEPSPALRDLEERILLHDPDLGAVAPPPALHNLPALTTSFLGRNDDLVGVSTELASHRIVTLLGGPGLGKTRLSIEAGYATLDRFPDGVWFVSLSGTATALDVAAAIATAARAQFEVTSLADLADQLSRQHALLILDNCEHVIEPCRVFASFAAGGVGNMTILATSRRPLGVDGERLWRLQPLASPSAPLNETDPLIVSPAVQLFVDRAQSVDRTFTLAAHPAASVYELSRRLEGVPLAIELAARWVSALSIEEIASMIVPSEASREAGAAVVVDDSLGSAISWSLDLLARDDRDLLLRAAAFTGPFTLPDAHAVSGVDRTRAQFSAAMARLVDASLLTVDRHGTDIRYKTLAPIREVLLLTGHDEAGAIAAAHAGHFLEKAGQSQEDLYTATLDLETTHHDISDIRTALEYGLTHEWNDDVARTLSRLSYYFHQRYLHWESQAWLDRVLERELSPEPRGYALRALGSGAQILGHQSKAAKAFEEAISIFTARNDDNRATRCLMSLSGVHSDRGEWDLGLEAARRAYRSVSAGDNRSAIAIASYYIGENLYRRGDPSEALPYLRESAEIFHETAEYGRAAYASGHVARAAFHTYDEMLALDAATTATAAAARAGSDYVRTKALGASALAAATWGDPQTAARLLVEADGKIIPGHPDEVYDLLLPAAATLVRSGAWDLVEDIVLGVRDHVDTTESAMPAPWVETMAEWETETIAHGVTGGAGSPARDLGALRAGVMVQLRLLTTITTTGTGAG